MPFAKIHRLDVYYESHGDGSTIVLLHHGFACTKMWCNIYSHLVENAYRVALYDRKGYGQSEKGVDFQVFYEGDKFRAESVKELTALGEAVGFGAFHIIGQCEGGVIGVDYAATYPQEVKTLVTSSTKCFSLMSVPNLTSRNSQRPLKFGA